MSVDRRTFIASTATALAALSTRPANAQSPSPAAPANPARGFGWIRDRPDPSDRKLAAPSFISAASRPIAKDLSAQFAMPYDQGQVGSCTANAIAAAVQYARKVHNKPEDFVPSRLFIYYYERLMEGQLYTDSGAQIRDGIKAVVQYGVPKEESWAYEDIPGDPTTRVFPSGCRAITQPTASVVAEAAKYRTISYAPLKQDAVSLETCIASGYPFVFGFTVFDNLTNSVTRLRKPGPSDQITPYGHAVLATGYNQNTRTFKIRNSWGPTCHSGGYFEMDYDYLLDTGLAADFWVVYQTLGFLGGAQPK